MTWHRHVEWYTGTVVIYKSNMSTYTCTNICSTTQVSSPVTPEQRCSVVLKTCESRCLRDPPATFIVLCHPAMVGRRLGHGSTHNCTTINSNKFSNLCLTALQYLLSPENLMSIRSSCSCGLKHKRTFKPLEHNMQASPREFPAMRAHKASIIYK